jgi:hypothetical protein
MLRKPKNKKRHVSPHHRLFSGYILRRFIIAGHGLWIDE